MSTLYLVPADLQEATTSRSGATPQVCLRQPALKNGRTSRRFCANSGLLASEVIVGGGNRSLISRRIDGAFYARGWQEKGFATSILVDNEKFDSPTHAVDCLKNSVAVEMEWNNKDPFFDRDLNNFRLLFELRAIQVGVVITRSWELQAIFQQLGKGSSYGKATTHHEKLWPKIEGGGGGGCPILTFAIRPALFEDDGPSHSRF